MDNGKVCVYIPVEEYRELVQAKRDADCLKAILLQQKESYGGMKHEQLVMICTMFGLKEEEKRQEEESW